MRKYERQHDMTMQAWRTFNDGVQVIIEIDGKSAKGIPWRAADEIAAALKVNARICEQNEKAEPVIYDAAIVARAGMPIGLIHNNPKMKDEACKVCQFDRTIRKSNLPKMGAVPSQEVVGTPVISRPSPSLADLKKAAQ